MTKQPLDLMRDGANKVTKGEGSAWDGYQTLAQAVGMIYAKLPEGASTTAVRSGIEKALLADAGKNSTKAAHELLLGDGSDKDRKRANDLRAALLWMHQQPEQLATMVASGRDRSPVAMRSAWKRHQAALIRETLDEGDGHITLADNLEGVNQKEAKALLDKAKAAKKKRDDKIKAEREKDEAELAKMQEPTLEEASATDIISQLVKRDDADSIAKAVLHFLELESQKKAPQFVEVEKAGDLTAIFAEGKRDFGLYSPFDRDKVVMTGKVIPRQKLILLNDGTELPIKSVSAKSVREALFLHFKRNNIEDIEHRRFGFEQ